MTGQLFLAGGGNEKQSRTIDEIFLRNVKKILYIPWAWPDDNFEACKKWFSRMIQKHRNDVQTDALTTIESPENLDQYDAIYIGGGNTFKLLKRLRESGLGKKLKDYYQNRGVIYGGSAGAIILGKNIETALLCKDKDVNLVKLQNLSALNLAMGCDIQCHYEPEQLKEHQIHAAKTGRNIIAIPEESAVLVKDNKFKAIGTKPITLITEGSAKEYQPGEHIQI